MVGELAVGSWQWAVERCRERRLAANCPPPAAHCPLLTANYSRQRVERIAGDAEHRPVVERNRSQGFIEVDGGLVPVEDGPFEAAAVALLRDRGEPREQRLAI